MSWRNIGVRAAAATTVAVLVVMVAMTVIAVAESVTDRRDSAAIRGFNACITHTSFLVLRRQRNRRPDREPENPIESITDRARGAVVGEVGGSSTAAHLGGAAAVGGRYLMSTATPVGRDAGAVEGCWDRVFPIAPDD